jgi:leader peptidase (prepilin peptidase)/N-methyltransferase
MILTVGIIVAAVLGLIFGSFLNVCITRLPLGESIAWPGSHCRSCNHALPWYMNLPGVSWPALKGRCAYCKERIPARYFLVEVATAALWVGCWLHWCCLYSGGFDADAHLQELSSFPFYEYIPFALLSPVTSALSLWLLLGLAVMDWEGLFLSDWFTISGALAGILWAAISIHIPVLYEIHQQPQVVHQLIIAAAFAGFFLLVRWLYWLLRKQEGLGMGDVKLAAMIGAWLSWEQSLLTLLMAVLSALIYATFLMIRNPEAKKGQIALPFGSFLAGAAIVSYFAGTTIWNRYMQLWHLA